METVDNALRYHVTVDDFGRFLRTRRAILGLSQRDLAERAGVKQPLIAAIESGRRMPSKAARLALVRAVDTRPSVALSERSEEVLEAFARSGLAAPKVFGSIARRSDTIHSDIDLMVEFTDRHDICDLLALEEELEEILTFKVDVVDAREQGAVIDQATTEAVGF